MKKYLILTIITVSLFIIGSGTKGGPDLTLEASRKTVKNLPDWHMNTPVKNGFQYAGAEATSQSIHAACC
jgi:hypothetical protein